MILPSACLAFAVLLFSGHMCQSNPPPLVLGTTHFCLCNSNLQAAAFLSTDMAIHETGSQRGGDLCKAGRIRVKRLFGASLLGDMVVACSKMLESQIQLQHCNSSLYLHTVDEEIVQDEQVNQLTGTPLSSLLTWK